VCVVKRGRVIAEISGVDKKTAKGIFKSVSYKLPMKVKFVEAEATNVPKESGAGSVDA